MRKMVSFGLGKKKKMFFGLVTIVGQRKILFVFFQCDFVL